MFSCCALFSTDDGGADMEHLKALDEVEVGRGEEVSVSIDGDGADAWRFEDTPVATSPRAAVIQPRALGTSSITDLAQSDASHPSPGKPTSEADQQSTAPMEEGDHYEEGDVGVEEGREEEVRNVSRDGAEGNGVGMEDAEARSEAQTTAANSSATAERADQTLRALREAEDTAHATAAEAERRRFEEEASARAARQAECEARKALWRAEEAQKVKELAGPMAAEEDSATVDRIAHEEAELARRQEDSARTEKARLYVTGRLSSDEGLRLQKHGRNGKTASRTLTSPDPDFQTLTWGKTLHDFRSMQEVRMGTDPDPAYPGLTGTSELRRSKAARSALDRSFSLLFPSRSLDFTVATTEECERLVMGFRALSAFQWS